jgi:hypothetical protein
VFYDADGAMNNDIKVLMEMKGFNVQIAQYSTTFLRCTCESPTTALKSMKVDENGVKLLYKRCSLKNLTNCLNLVSIRLTPAPPRPVTKDHQHVASTTINNGKDCSSDTHEPNIEPRNTGEPVLQFFLEECIKSV